MCHKKVNILRFASLLVAIAVLLSALGGFTAFAAREGSCGKDLEWSFSGGTLIITGKGEMANYTEANKAPWYDFADEITTLVLPEKLETIGALSFYNCTSLKAVNIPQNVKAINSKAFYKCTALETVTLPSNLKTIGTAAFFDCEALCALNLPQGLESIGDKAFYLCRSLVTVTIPESVKALGEEAFVDCKSLLRVDIKAKIKEIPAWCFYGCSSLIEVKLSDTVTDVNDYAFTNCELLNTVYCSGNEDVAKKIKKQIIDDNPSFKAGGQITVGELDNITETTQTETDKKGNEVLNTNTTVQVEGNVTVVTKVENVIEKGKSESYSVEMTLTIESDKDWNAAILMVRNRLAEINAAYSNGDIKLTSINITLYLKGVDKVSEDFLKELAGRNITLEVVSSNGSVWFVDCLNLKLDNVKNDTGISYTITDASDKAKDKLGTDNCYSITFDTTSKLDANVVISLPKSNANGNAFLYYVSGGKYKRVQGTVIDADGNARFYLSSIHKNGKYVVGVNVPGESFDDVIISDEASDPFGAIARLEKIEYVPAGPRTFAGFTIGQFTLIVLGVLLFIIIVVGVSMYMINKNRPQKFAFMGDLVKKVNTKKPFKKTNKK